MEIRQSTRAVMASALALAAVVAVNTPVGASGTGWTIAPVVSGLEGPRGVAFDGRGNLYVSETGKYTDRERPHGRQIPALREWRPARVVDGIRFALRQRPRRARGSRA